MSRNTLVCGRLFGTRTVLLGWAYCLAVLCWAVLGCVGLCCAGLAWPGLAWAWAGLGLGLGLGWPGLAWPGLAWAGLGCAVMRIIAIFVTSLALFPQMLQHKSD